MIDKEVIQRESEWVKTRLNCTAEQVFDQLLTVIESDIRVFSKMNGSEDCEVTRDGERSCTFRRGTQMVNLAMHGSVFKSTAYCGNAVLSDSAVEIVPKWNDEELSCNLMMDGVEISIYRASQKIIGNLLFPE